MPTQTTNFTTSSTLAYTGPNQTWIVNPGVTGEIQGSPVVDTNQPGSRLENSGTLISHVTTALLFGNYNGSAADGSSVLNAVGASIMSDQQAAYASFGCNGASVDNRGSMSGAGVGLFFSQSTNATLVNSGTIFGNEAGVRIASTDGAVVTNTGFIYSEQYGLWVLDGVGFRPEVTNSGTIGGNLASVVVENGDRLLLTNTGTLNGDVLCKSVGQKDKIVNSGTINGDVFLGPGNDTFKGKGGKADGVFGEDGKDRIIGGIESETFSGGPGKDAFVFGAPLNAVSNVDTITDLSVKNEIIELDNKIFTRLKHEGALDDKFFDIGSKAGDRNDYLVYDKVTGFLGYDADGKKHGAELVVFARLEDHLKLKADNFLVI